MVSSLIAGGLTTSVLRTYNENPLYKALAVEILGINIPKTVLVRTKKEAMDVGVNEFGNTIGFFGGVWAIGRLANTYLKGMGIRFDGAASGLSQARLVKTFMLIPPLFAFMWSTPYFRNAFTAWQNGTTNYRRLITTQMNDLDKNLPPERQREQVKDRINENLEKAAGILGIGLLVTTAGLLLTGLRRNPFNLFKNGKPVGLMALPTVEKVLNKLCLQGDSATVFKDFHSLVYWGLPAYAGWVTASRDEFEVKEQLLKAANFGLVFGLTDPLVKTGFNSVAKKLAAQAPEFYPQFNAPGPGGKALMDTSFSYSNWIARTSGKPISDIARKVIRFENIKSLSMMGSTILLMAITPTLINWYLSAKRIERVEARERMEQAGFRPPGFKSEPSHSQSRIIQV